MKKNKKYENNKKGNKLLLLFNSDHEFILINKSNSYRKKKLKIIKLFLSFFFIFIIIYQKLKFNKKIKIMKMITQFFLGNNNNNKSIIITKIYYILLKRVNETYEKEGFVNINEIESKIAGGRPWIKPQNKTKEINIGLGINSNYTLKAMMTISSIMDSQKLETKLRLHIGVVEKFSAENMIKIYNLRERIRNDVEFNFYNSAKVETELKGVHTKGNAVMAKLLLSLLLPNDVERIIIFDTGDLLVLRDLTEMYNWDMKNKTFCGVVDPLIGLYGRISKKIMNIYINAGNFLIDVKKFKNEKIYEKIVANKNVYSPSPVILQAYLNDVAYGKIGYLPMRFGTIGLFKNDKRSDYGRPDNTEYKFIKKLKYKKKYSFLPKNIHEMNVQAYNPVVIHQWNGKWMKGDGLTIYRRIAQYYIKYAGIMNEMCEKHPGYCIK